MSVKTIVKKAVKGIKQPTNPMLKKYGKKTK